MRASLVPVADYTERMEVWLSWTGADGRGRTQWLMTTDSVHALRVARAVNSPLPSPNFKAVLAAVSGRVKRRG